MKTSCTHSFYLCNHLNDKKPNRGTEMMGSEQLSFLMDPKKKKDTIASSLLVLIQFWRLEIESHNHTRQPVCCSYWVRFSCPWVFWADFDLETLILPWFLCRPFVSLYMHDYRAGYVDSHSLWDISNTIGFSCYVVKRFIHVFDPMTMHACSMSPGYLLTSVVYLMWIDLLASYFSRSHY